MPILPNSLGEGGSNRLTRIPVCEWFCMRYSCNGMEEIITFFETELACIK